LGQPQGLLRQFYQPPDAIPNAQLRAQVNRYLKEQLSRKLSAKERKEAAIKTIQMHGLLSPGLCISPESTRDLLDGVLRPSIAAG
jgi:hypothetical protein